MVTCCWRIGSSAADQVRRSQESGNSIGAATKSAKRCPIRRTSAEVAPHFVARLVDDVAFSSHEIRARSVWRTARSVADNGGRLGPLVPNADTVISGVGDRWQDASSHEVVQRSEEHTSELQSRQ